MPAKLPKALAQTGNIANPDLNARSIKTHKPRSVMAPIKVMTTTSKTNRRTNKTTGLTKVLSRNSSQKPRIPWAMTVPIKTRMMTPRDVMTLSRS